MSEKCCCHLILPDGTKVVIKDSVARQLIETINTDISSINQNISDIKNKNVLQDSNISNVVNTLSKKVSRHTKVEQSMALYCTVNGVDSVIYALSGSPSPESIPKRNGNGEIIASDPTSAQGVVTKKYFEANIGVKWRTSYNPNKPVWGIRFSGGTAYFISEGNNICNIKDGIITSIGGYNWQTELFKENGDGSKTIYNIRIYDLILNSAGSIESCIVAVPNDSDLNYHSYAVSIYGTVSEWLQ